MRDIEQRKIMAEILDTREWRRSVFGRMRHLSFGVFLLMSSAPCVAQGPHEIAVLVNEESPDSVAVANAFVRLRCVPSINVIPLRLPVASDTSGVEISRDAFTEKIWQPAMETIRERGLEKQILAWVYSVDFPVRIQSNPPVSLQGITFIRNLLPPPDVIRDGRYVSPLYAGPDVPGGAAHFAQTFDVYSRWLADEMPLPSMMLGYTGIRGNTTAEVLECMERGRASDGILPDGTVYFIVSDDIRSRCREWQFPSVKEMLEERGVRAGIVKDFPSHARDIMGIMMGTANVNPGRAAGFLPGCMAEHLTSSAAAFDKAMQTKLTAWIRAGATASAGTVTEPRSIWTKFPSAYFFAFHASGCTMMESFFQSIESPLQILLVGEPLASPWAPRATLVIPELEKGAVSGRVRLHPEIQSEQPARYGRYLVLVDGRVHDDKGASPVIDALRLESGRRHVRVVAYRTGLVRQQVFAEYDVIVGKEHTEGP